MTHTIKPTELSGEHIGKRVRVQLSTSAVVEDTLVAIMQSTPTSGPWGQGTSVRFANLAAFAPDPAGIDPESDVVILDDEPEVL
ncbi:hypothetical protein [Gryllotalpicola koreensis]|uniref:Uncharacterized protein n=1 Tax=Gryllotalpicola koreensis TaxID=993086 RepID=A0ABP8A301_9MICO